MVTTIYLLRLRHQFRYVRRREPFQLMAEETVALAVKVARILNGSQVFEVDKLLECVPSGNLSKEAMTREINYAIAFLQENQAKLEALAEDVLIPCWTTTSACVKPRAILSQYGVNACLPVDVIGVFVLLPDAL